MQIQPDLVVCFFFFSRAFVLFRVITYFSQMIDISIFISAFINFWIHLHVFIYEFSFELS